MCFPLHETKRLQPCARPRDPSFWGWKLGFFSEGKRTKVGKVLRGKKVGEEQEGEENAEKRVDPRKA